jgi:hypothetical protein
MWLLALTFDFGLRTFVWLLALTSDSRLLTYDFCMDFGSDFGLRTSEFCNEGSSSGQQRTSVMGGGQMANQGIMGIEPGMFTNLVGVPGFLDLSRNAIEKVD